MDTGWRQAANWWPASRGRSWDFALPAETIVEVLTTTAGMRDDEFTLLQCDKVESDREWHSIYREVPVTELSDDASWQYFIRSRLLHPAIPTPARRSGAGWPSEFSLNGLMLLHYPDPVRRDVSGAATLGIMHRIGHKDTSEIVEYLEADALYATLKRALRRAASR